VVSVSKEGRRHRCNLCSTVRADSGDNRRIDNSAATQAPGDIYGQKCWTWRDGDVVGRTGIAYHVAWQYALNNALALRLHAPTLSCTLLARTRSITAQNEGQA